MNLINLMKMTRAWPEDKTVPRKLAKAIKEARGEEKEKKQIKRKRMRVIFRLNERDKDRYRMRQKELQLKRVTDKKYEDR